MTPEAYLDALLNLPAAFDVQISPDGTWVAWSWFGIGPAADVYAAPTDGSLPPVRLTNTADNTYLVNWTPNSRSVLVEQDKDGNERSRLFRVDIEQPLVMVPLTAPDPKYFLRGGALHPNGKYLVYGANFDVATGEEIEATWIYRYDRQTADRLPLARPQKGGYIWPQLSPDGQHILYSRVDLHPAGRQVWLVDIDGQEDREILNFGAAIKAFASWFPDSQRVLVIGETPTHRRVGLWTLGDPPSNVRWLLDDPSRNIESAYVPPNSEQIVLVEAREARLRCSLLDVNGSESALPPVPGNLRLIAPTPNGEWIGLYYSAQQPPDVVRFDLAAPDPQHFTSLARVWEQTKLTPADLIPAEDFRWKSVDGLEIQGWLYRAQGQARGTIVYVHGGPTSHSQDNINPQIQFFVREGFHVLDPNYRGSTGFSLAYREAIKEDGWGGREQEDIRTGIEALISAGIAEAGKVGITGTSYGGYSAWCAITRFAPEILAASAPICGMTDLVVDYETTRPDLRPYSEEMMGGSPATVPQRYHERSPINFVEQIKGRLLIVQGMQDPNVSPENVRTVTEALQKAGVEYELLAFDDEGHGISKHHNRRKLYLQLRDFFGSWA